ncbi:hypothetical protein HDU98_006377 [Podochytrium sp. JEL0797]|nr:hypothetical protein HDU98_006377 [Podochytrium sp. JEL0797]
MDIQSAGSGALHMGKHCEALGCNRLDFLPFKCHLCKGTYCDEHTKFSFHVNCRGIQNNTVIECPVCMKPVGGTSSLQSMSQINDAISLHIDNGCVDIAAIDGKQRKREKQCHGFAKPGVRCTSSALTSCKQCNNQFCAKHRFYEDHACQKGQGNSRASSAAQSRASSVQSSPRIGKNANASVRGSSSASTANLTQKAKAKPVPVVCPICHQNVDGADSSMTPNQVNEIVSRHIDAGCPAPKKSGLLGWLGL